MQFSYDKLLRCKEFMDEINSCELKEIEWTRDDGSVLEVNSQLIEEWKNIGMTNTTFAEFFLSRVAIGEESLLLEELGCK